MIVSTEPSDTYLTPKDVLPDDQCMLGIDEGTGNGAADHLCADTGGVIHNSMVVVKTGMFATFGQQT